MYFPNKLFKIKLHQISITDILTAIYNFLDGNLIIVKLKRIIKYFKMTTSTFHGSQ